MIKYMILSLIIAIPLMAKAVSSDFAIHSCASSTGRTQLNVFQDNHPYALKPYIIRLIIDGQMAEYTSNKVHPDDLIEYDKDTGTFSIFEHDQLVLSFTKKKTSVLIKKGFLDPRKGTEFTFNGDNQSDIDTHCRIYEERQ